jgi:TRAP-type C4-dicarboxylate transport system permease small subunit
MEGLTGGLERLIDKLSTALAQLAAASALLLTGVVTYSVVMRFVFNSSQNWADELASYCLLWMVFLGLTYTLNAGAHIRIDFLTGSFPASVRWPIEAATWALGTLFAVLLFLGCLSEVENFIHRGTYSTEGLDIPLVWPALPMLLGSGLFALAMAARFLRVLFMGLPASSTEQHGGPS